MTRRPVAHYCQGGIECIDALKAALGPERFEGFLAGNVIKYMWRYRHKNGLDDLYKAQTYLGWLIEESGSMTAGSSKVEQPPYKGQVPGSTPGPLTDAPFGG